jgi:hypothetical protein
VKKLQVFAGLIALLLLVPAFAPSANAAEVPSSSVPGLTQAQLLDCTKRGLQAVSTIEAPLKQGVAGTVDLGECGVVSLSVSVQSDGQAVQAGNVAPMGRLRACALKHQQVRGHDIWRHETCDSFQFNGAAVTWFQNPPGVTCFAVAMNCAAAAAIAERVNDAEVHVYGQAHFWATVMGLTILEFWTDQTIWLLGDGMWVIQQ